MLFTIRQRSIPGQPQAPKAAKFPTLPLIAASRLSTPSKEKVVGREIIISGVLGLRNSLLLINLSEPFVCNRRLNTGLWL